MANPVPAGSDVSAGTYKCTRCGNELEVARRSICRRSHRAGRRVRDGQRRRPQPGSVPGQIGLRLKGGLPSRRASLMPQANVSTQSRIFPSHRSGATDWAGCSQRTVGAAWRGCSSSRGAAREAAVRISRRDRADVEIDAFDVFVGAVDPDNRRSLAASARSGRRPGRYLQCGLITFDPARPARRRDSKSRGHPVE